LKFFFFFYFFFFIDQRISAVSDGECVGRHHAMPPIPTTTIAQLKRLPVTNSSFDSDLHVCFGNCFLLFSFVLLFIPFGCFDGKEQKKKKRGEEKTRHAGTKNDARVES
jgi:hypothetical protein